MEELRSRRCWSSRRLTVAPCLLALALTACVTGEKVSLSFQPQGPEREPPIGRLVDLRLRYAGGPLRLQAAVGRVTVLCVFREVGQLVDACGAAQRRWGDRITLVGLSLDDSEALPIAPEAPFRVYRDPSGRELRASLGIEPGPTILLTDRRGRVAQVVSADSPGELERALTSLVG